MTLQIAIRLAKACDFKPGQLLAAGLIALATVSPARAHDAFYLYEASATNTYEPTNPGGQADYQSGATPQQAAVEGARSYAVTTHGGTVFAGAELPGMDPFALRNIEYASGKGYLAYNFWIDGPDPDALVPVRFQAIGGVTSNSSAGTGGILLRLSEVGLGGKVFQWSDVGQGNDEDTAFQDIAAIDVDQIFYFKPSMTYHIEMSASAGVQARVDKGAFATASLDPAFTVLGDFVRDYQVVGVPGDLVTPPPGPAVPEPATWALMVMGFGLLGGSLRRRRLLTVPAA